jgi:hypothetical protein
MGRETLVAAVLSLILYSLLPPTATAGTPADIEWSMAFNPGQTSEDIGAVEWSRTEPGVVYFAGNGSAHDVDGQNPAGTPRYPYSKLLPEGAEIELASRSRGIYVGKIDTRTNALQFFSFVLFGASASNVLRVTDMAVDYDGNILVVGHSSTFIEQTDDFPYLRPGPGCRNSQFNSGFSRDGFIAKISADGEQLMFACYYGASGDDWITGIDVLPNNSFAISMYTTSSDWGLSGAGGTQLSGPQDGFVAVHLANFALASNAYFGGSGSDALLDIKVVDGNRLVAVGLTDSLDLATTADAYQSASNGQLEAMLVEFEHMNLGVTYATYAGGTGNESFQQLDVDAASNVYVVGTSNSIDYPTVGREARLPVATVGAVVSKFSPDLRRLLFSSFHGITIADYWSGEAIGVSAQGDIVIGGQADAPDWFPMINRISALNAPDYEPSFFEDGYVIKWLNAGGEYELDYQTLIGSRGTVKSIDLADRERVLVSGDVFNNPFLDDAYHFQQISDPGVSFGPFAMVLRNEVTAANPPPGGGGQGGGGGGGTASWLLMFFLGLAVVGRIRSSQN